MKNDIATAERLRITATTLDGILTVKGQGRGERRCAPCLSVRPWAQLMEEIAAQGRGRRTTHGHEYMDLERFAEDTRHMIIFDVLTHDSPVGWKGERTRLFLTEAGYQKSLENQEKGHIKILSHAKVRQGHLYYDPLRSAALKGACHDEIPAAAAGGPALVSSATPAKSVERRR